MKGNEKEGQTNTGQPECAEDEARLIGDLIREIMDRQGFLRPALPVRPQGGDLNKNGGSDFQAAPSRLTKCVKVSGGIHAAWLSGLYAAIQLRTRSTVLVRTSRPLRRSETKFLSFRTSTPNLVSAHSCC